MDNDLPRNQIPELFHPHRTEFTCKHELTVAPPLDPQAEAWYQEAMVLDTPDLWKDDRDWPRIVELYTKAAERKHWKAMNNLATLHQTGVWGLRDSSKVLVVRDPKAAMALTEEAMRMGVPLAYAVMGNYYNDGFIVKRDPTAAWAFWQKAADMGNSYAQFTIGRSLLTAMDAPERSRWANTPLGIKMLECAFAQGHSDAAEELGLQYEVVEKDKSRALHYYHEGVKLGSAGSANALFAEFRKVDGLSPFGKDQSRSERYNVLGDALDHNPDLRFPNLDRVLPLPPAKLPQWSGKPEDLINAAKPVIPAPPPAATTPGANLSGRAHIPQGSVLPEFAVPPEDETRLIAGLIEVRPQYEATTADFSGYWLPQLLHPVTLAHRTWNQDQVPRRYARGESFDDWRIGLTHNDGRILWHYMGVPEQLELQDSPAQVRSGQWRVAQANPAKLTCDGDEACPQSGIWQPSLSAEHPRRLLVNWRWREAAAMQGQAFPDPQRDWLVDVPSYAVTWRLVETI
ncbi:SEL1-like repeat protein [Collimonas antrihumi]|uniref:SEL1-like repeat protein n=1 Tax=Collimonas antrihumi TaxID=1940615 RepID=UPI001B8B0F95|nr:DUF6396 domain-containing protein [Collimonas antrihumi]